MRYYCLTLMGARVSTLRVLKDNGKFFCICRRGYTSQTDIIWFFPSAPELQPFFRYRKQSTTWSLTIPTACMKE